MAETPERSSSKTESEPEKMPVELLTEIMKQKIRDNAHQLRTDFMERMDRQLNMLVDEFVDEVEINAAKLSDNNNIKTVKQRRKDGGLQDKEFVKRPSLLTELFEVSHINTIHNMFIAVLFLAFFHCILYDLFDNGGMSWDFSILYYSFGKLDIVLYVWLMMKLSTVVILYPGFEYWAWNRVPNKKYMDLTWFSLYILYQTAMFILPLRRVISDDLPPASSIALLCEQIRLIMKVHAFVRENIPRALRYKPHLDDDKSKDEENTPCPGFSKFLYFLFVPTLVYRDNYPRTKEVRWRYVLTNFLQVFGCVVYVFFVFARFCVPVFKRFGQEPQSAKSFVLSTFSCMMPGFLVFLSVFFAMLHCWMNAFAEMLRFGDRLFYRDWWNSTTFSNYYRTWNIVVHDWLYAYVYKDVCKITGSDNRLVPLFMVFSLSAVVHEYIVTFTFHFFFPILFIMFQGFGVWLVFVTRKAKSKVWNVFFWMSLIAGSGILLSFYSMEWYAHKNCPPSGGLLWDTFVPRFLSCEAVFPSSSSSN